MGFEKQPNNGDEVIDLEGFKMFHKQGQPHLPGWN
jgi:hypothetical protein